MYTYLHHVHVSELAYICDRSWFYNLFKYLSTVKLW